MKKTYLCPQTTVVTLQASIHLLTESIVGDKVYDKDASNQYDVLTRRHYSVWDDEEDDKE